MSEVINLRGRQQYVPRAEVVALWSTAPEVDLDRFRSDLEALDHDIEDPYAR
jgi:hypothetical protein